MSTKMYIKVRVVAGSKLESFEQKSDDTFFLTVKEKAKQGLANARVRQLLATNIGVPISCVRLVSGHTSPSKIFDIKEIS
ncbi:MAG: DUF167 domain-containing protein [bacterium]|nr:DUF167 domain-containing protein [bacterium]